MTDRTAYFAAVSVMFGAWRAIGFPLWVVVASIGLVVATRHPLPMCVALALCASVLGSRSLAGLQVELGDRSVVNEAVELLTDPVTTISGVRVEARIGSRHVQLWARGRLGSELDSHRAGDIAVLDGRLSPTSGRSVEYLRSRHIALRLDASAISSWRSGNVASRAANSFRSLVFGGARSLPPVERSLFAGFVLGDTHDQTADVADSFGASGLTHLMAVSGENMAFVLVAAGPMIRVGQRKGRFLITVVVLAFFCVATRWQPSVLRAAGMAAVGAYATLRGRRVSGLRILAVTVIVLTLIDPLLVRSAGFLLSVGASGGIILWGKRLCDAIRGPRLLADAIGITIAAQLGTLPLLLGFFGGIPVASVPANALAVPAAGPVMVWGLTGGLVAGTIGGRVAWALHLVDHVLLWWVAKVARASSSWGLGTLTLRHCLALALAVGVWRFAARGATHSRRRGLLKAVAGLGVVAIVVSASEWLTPPLVGTFEIVGRSELHISPSASVLVLGWAEPKVVLADLRARGVDHLDVIVVHGATWASARAAEPVIRQMTPALVVVAPSAQQRGMTAAHDGEQWTLGDITITVTSTSPSLIVTIDTG